MARRRQVEDGEILEVARACFLEHGPAVSTNVIADRLSISQAALFKRFGTKEDLMVAALAPPEEPEWLPLVLNGPDQRPIPDQLREVAGAVHRFFVKVTPCLAVLQASGMDMRGLFARYQVPPPVRAHRGLSAWFAAARRQGRVRPCDPDAVALMFIGALHGRHFLAKVGVGLPTDEAYLDEMVHTLWRGVAPEEGA